ncbi:WD40-repeat-containing domain [Pseudocohnilembus persalinus]|uniref:WD40-repeat-containing domain n=1 Tax=Pseudocohnilembus persalinus TaxID=266149 RepID=A0A0V0QEU3_PSEPJ|nr:WD40-repeat-containing domain [Pseudocohnilembus persalinus]|eukprot:KRX00667.1 WD40-repeat-containing domain [Pseudocohnilembus persalinus]
MIKFQSPLDTLNWINQMIPKMQRQKADPKLNEIIFQQQNVKNINESKISENESSNDSKVKQQILDNGVITNELDDIKVDQILANELQKKQQQQKSLQNSSIIQNQEYEVCSKDFVFPFEKYKPQYSQEHLEFLQFHYLDEINQPLFQKYAKQLSKIRCIAVTQKKIVAAGNLGNVLSIDKESRQQQLFKTDGNFGTITTIDLKENLLAIGFERGQLTFIDIKENDYLMNDQKTHQENKLLNLKIFHQEKEKNLIISVDNSGNTFLIRFYKKLFGHNIKFRDLVPKQDLPFQYIEIMNKELNQKYMKDVYKNQVLLGLGNNKCIVIVSINCQTEESFILHQIQNKGFSLIECKEFFSSICWGQGYIQSDRRPSRKQYLYSIQLKKERQQNQLQDQEEQEESQTQDEYNQFMSQQKTLELLFFYSWNNKIGVCKPLWRFEEYMIQNENLYKPILEFEDSKQLELKNNIISCRFLAPSIMYVMDFQQIIYLINTNELQIFRQFQDFQDIPKLQYCLPLSDTIFCQLFEIQAIKGNVEYQNIPEKYKGLDNDTLDQLMQSQKVKRVQIYSNSFSDNQINHESYYLMESKVGIAVLNSWQKLVNRMIEHQEWILAMHFLITVYNQQNNFVNILGYDKNQISKAIDETVGIVATRFIQMSMRLLKMNEKKDIKNNVIVILIDFLLKTGQNKLLFEEIKNITEAYFGNVSYFMECLEPFINEGRIQKVSCKNVLKEIIEFYKKNNKLSVIQRLITTLDLSHPVVQEYSSNLIKICLDNGLIKGLIYICYKEQNYAFMAPLSKLWGLYLSHKFNKKNQEARFFGLRALWYVRMNLLRQTIDGQEIDLNSQQFSNIIQQMAEWTLYDKNLKEMMQLSPLYDPKDDPKWVKTEDKTTCDQGIILINKCYEDVLQLPSEKKNFREILTNEYNVFIAKIIQEGGFKITNTKIIDTIIFLIQNPQALKTLKIFDQVNFLTSQVNNREEIIHSLHSKFIENLLYKIIHDLRENEKQRILEYSDKSAFDQISILIYANSKQYGKCIDIFLQTKNELTKGKIFNWLKQLLHGMQSEEQYEDLRNVKQIIVNKLRDLLKVDIEQTREIISKYLKSEETFIVQKLNDYSDLQLEYIQNILENDREEGIKIEESILIRHIELLCKLKPKKTKEQLKLWDYPLDKCEKICKENKILDAYAYLLEKNGKIGESLSVHIEILEKYVVKILKYLTEPIYKERKQEKYQISGNQKSISKTSEIKNTDNGKGDEKNDDDNEDEIVVESYDPSNKETQDTNIENVEISETQQEILERQRLQMLMQSQIAINETNDQFQEQYILKAKKEREEKLKAEEQQRKKMELEIKAKEEEEALKQQDQIEKEDFYLEKWSQRCFQALDEGIKTIKSNSQSDDCEKTWFKYFDELLEIETKFLNKDSQDQQKLMKLLKKMIGKLVYDMSQGLKKSRKILDYKQALRVSKQSCRI